MKRKIKIAGVLAILYGMIRIAGKIWGGWFNIFDNMSIDRTQFSFVESNGTFIILALTAVLFILGLALLVGQVYKEEFRKKIYGRIYLVLLALGILVTGIIAYDCLNAQKPYLLAVEDGAEVEPLEEEAEDSIIAEDIWNQTVRLLYSKYDGTYLEISDRSTIDQVKNLLESIDCKEIPNPMLEGGSSFEIYTEETIRSVGVSGDVLYFDGKCYQTEKNNIQESIENLFEEKGVPSKSSILDSIYEKNKDVRVSYKIYKDGYYEGVYVRHNGKTLYFDWVLDADILDNCYPLEISYLQNKILKNHHLLIQFTKEFAHGVPKLINEAYMVNLDTMTEVLIQSPTEILEQENITDDISGITYKIEKAKLICNIVLQTDIEKNIEIIYEYKDGIYQMSTINYTKW